MIKCKLSILMGTHRDTIQDIHIKTKINRNTLSNLYHEKTTRLDFDTLDKLCAYFNCQVSDLLEYKKTQVE